MLRSITSGFASRFALRQCANASATLNALNKAIAIIEFTPAGIILNANDLFLSRMGYRLDEIQGQHHRMFCPAELVSSPKYQAFWQRLERGESFSNKFLRLDKQGRPVWL
ncbi:PAS domain-containing protein, partial [Mixta calida]